MTTTSSPVDAPARWWLTTLLVLAVATPSLFGLLILGVLVAAPLGLLAPAVPVVLAFAYRAAVRGALTAEGRAVVRETGGVSIGAMLAFGTYVSMQLIGIGLDVLPFMASSGNYDNADGWNMLSVLVAVMTGVGVWWMLRRWADSEAAR